MVTCFPNGRLDKVIGWVLLIVEIFGWALLCLVEIFGWVLLRVEMFGWALLCLNVLLSIVVFGWNGPKVIRCQGRRLQSHPNARWDNPRIIFTLFQIKNVFFEWRQVWLYEGYQADGWEILAAWSAQCLDTSHPCWWYILSDPGITHAAPFLYEMK